MKTTLFLACATMVLGLSSCSTPICCDLDTSYAVLNNIATRTSVRKYTDQKVEKEKITAMLKAAMAAPTAANFQPWDFVVVDDAALIDSLQTVVQYAPIRSGNCSTVIAVCGNMDKAMEGESRAYWIQDCSAATENLLLAAHGLGLGAVWCGVCPIKESMEGVARILAMPSNIKPLCIICVGYPAEQPTPLDKWKEQNVHYNSQW